MNDESRDEYPFDYDEAEPNRFIDPALRAELERRIALADADPSRGVPWEEVLAAVRARWKK